MFQIFLAIWLCKPFDADTHIFCKKWTMNCLRTSHTPQQSCTVRAFMRTDEYTYLHEGNLPDDSYCDDIKKEEY